MTTPSPDTAPVLTSLPLTASWFEGHSHASGLQRQRRYFWWLGDGAVDLAGSVLPVRVVGGRIATVAVKEFIFKQPVRVGDLLSFYARISRIGRTSISVEVECFAERAFSHGQLSRSRRPR